ncbi:hypothetical protein A9Q94_01340 [Rhodobacterales bacterium 56_14_T64]|nr:hypothetical protein A9Q94_01340 [Rhodobacterales bacterium 56_14_T64]
MGERGLDDALFTLHENAVAWRHAPFHELMTQEKNRSLFSQRMMMPPSRLINATTVHTLTEFTLLCLAGNKCINFE